MSELNTLLMKVQVDAPNVRANQDLTTYIPVGSTTIAGTFKPDGKQLVVDSDGTLHINNAYVGLIDTIEYTYDDDGNTIVTIKLTNYEDTGDVYTFVVNKGAQGEKGDTGDTGAAGADGAAGVSALVRILGSLSVASVPSTSFSGTTAISGFNRTPEVDEVFQVYLVGVSGEADGRVWLGLASVTEVSSTAVTWKLYEVIELTGPQGEQGEVGPEALVCTYLQLTMPESSQDLTTDPFEEIIPVSYFNRTPVEGETFFGWSIRTSDKTYLIKWQVESVSTSGATCEMLQYIETTGVQGIQGEKGESGVSVNLQDGIYYLSDNPPSSTTGLVELPDFADTAVGSAYVVKDSSETKYDLYYHGEDGTDWTIIDDWGGVPGPAGADGTSATIEVGTTVTGEAGTSASVTNSGTSSAAVFNFTIPKGDKGDSGSDGASIVSIELVEITD